jgi:quinohemoprotein ethanol dehydrogenase
MRFTLFLVFTASCCLTLTPTPFQSSSISPTTDAATEWVMHGRTDDEQRFSPLNQMNDQNIDKLGLVWSHEFGTARGLEATPLETNGVIYTTGEWSVVYALDAKTGQVLWTYDPKAPRARALYACCDIVNRGVAFYQGKVYVGTFDGRLVALDAKSGTPVWDVVTVDQSKPYSITGAPRIARGMVLIGNAGSEYAVRGYLSAYDAETGKLVWRTYTVPGDPARGFESKALEEAAKTWKGKWWEAGGGGSPWDTIVYDPQLDLVYTGTANGIAWYRALRGEGDNLYLASILALRAKDGELVWYFQTTPGENWDYDATQPLMLADLELGGRQRKVIMQASKNGFFYVLDRETGEFLSARTFVPVTWATGVDAKTGRPNESSTAYDGAKPVIVSPEPAGAHNWYPMAFNPATGFVYVPARAGTTRLHVPDTGWKLDSRRSNRGNDTSYEGPLLEKALSAAHPVGKLIAWDPIRQQEAWHVDLPGLESGGVLATAGNLVFQGRSDGIFVAYRATDGKKLWEFDAGTGIIAPPVTYLLDGVQHITLMVGWGGGSAIVTLPGKGLTRPGFGRILTFALGANGRLEIPPFGHHGPPKPAIVMHAPQVSLREGRSLFALHCRVCHGSNAVSDTGVPDLRYATADVHKQFEAIVIGGARESRGMPSFKDLLNVDQVRAIQAYVLLRATESAEAPREHPQ